jgi:hypothetical protein
MIPMMNKGLAMVTLNVRDLGKGCGAKKQIKVKAWIQFLELPPQIVLLQEHHLSEAECVRYKKGMELKNGVAFWNPSLQLGHFQHWCARIVILMASNLTPAILQYGIIMEG